MFQYFEDLKDGNVLRGVLHGMKMYCSDLKTFQGLLWSLTLKEPWARLSEFNPVNSAIYHKNLDFIESLRKAGCDFSYRPYFGRQTYMHYACRIGNLEIVKTLIRICTEQGIEWIGAEQSAGSTVLHNACINPDLEILRYLLEEFKTSFNDRDLNIPAGEDYEYETPLFHACKHGPLLLSIK